MDALERQKKQRLPLHKLHEGKGIIVWRHILNFGVAREGKMKAVEGLLVRRLLIGQQRKDLF